MWEQRSGRGLDRAHEGEMKVVGSDTGEIASGVKRPSGLVGVVSNLGGRTVSIMGCNSGSGNLTSLGGLGCHGVSDLFVVEAVPVNDDRNLIQGGGDVLGVAALIRDAGEMHS